MNENSSPVGIILTLHKQVQALYSDGVLYFSGELTIATPERKALLLNNIQSIKAQIETLEQNIG